MDTNQKLKKLRSLMEEKAIDAYIVNTADPHQSEYLAEHYKTRVWISGFTGSAGTAVITKDKAILWADGRYYIQAEEQISGSEFQLFKIGIPGFPTYTQWLKDNLKDGDTVGFDGKIFAQSSFGKLEDEFKVKKINLVDEYDLVGEIWEDRPELPKEKTFIHELKYTGKTSKEKLDEVRKEMEKKEIDYFLLGSLDDIAWLCNIRGRDIKHTPVVISYTLISKDKAYIFIDKEKVDKEVEEFLNQNGIEVKKYEDVINYVENIEKDSKVFVDKNKTNRWIYNAIPSQCKIIDGTNITTILKGNKNKVEIENQKNAYIKDGVALVNFLHWIDTNIGKKEISEISAEEKLLEFRKEQKDFIEPSFSTISAYGPNAAMAHYSASEDSNAVLQEKGFYLVDSGGQYLDGTTDITRTITLGAITDEEKKDFTLTLKGHINLCDAKFLEKTTGHQLDMLCRAPLWKEGLDYKHGTGHGVGYLLGVHEGPHNISPAPKSVALEKGMVVSIEPGVYKAGKHGIRIENIVVVDEDVKTESGQFMKFEVLSFVPIDLKAIDVSLLNEEERQWINDYHRETYEKLSSYLSEEVRSWLKEQTRSI